jgi:hypothetical protein
MIYEYGKPRWNYNDNEEIKYRYTIPWDQTRFGNRNFSVSGMVVRGIRGQDLGESIAQLISTNWLILFIALFILSGINIDHKITSVLFISK